MKTLRTIFFLGPSLGVLLKGFSLLETTQHSHHAHPHTLKPVENRDYETTKSKPVV